MARVRNGWSKQLFAVRRRAWRQKRLEYTEQLYGDGGALSLLKAGDEIIDPQAEARLLRELKKRPGVTRFRT